MAEAMSEEQLAEIRAIADRDRWSTYCGHAGPRAIVTDLLDEVDRLRAQLAEIGETREAIAAAIENLPEPEAPGGYAVPAWYGGYEDGLDVAIRIVRGEQHEVPDA